MLRMMPETYARPSPSTEAPQRVTIAGRSLTPTPVFDTYWRFAAARQAVYEARLRGESGPWTRDPIISAHRFTNCFRASDRVSQYLIRSVIYRGDQAPEEVMFRALLFKMFNRISTWEYLAGEVGEPGWSSFDRGRYDAALTRRFEGGSRLYSAAYVMPPPRLGATRKHSNHLLLLELMMRDRLPDRLAAASTMQEAFSILRGYPAIGDFLAFQFLIDLNYSTALDFDEMEFVVPGPGARDGIRKCFGPSAAGLEAQLIAYMAATQDEHFERLGLTFNGLRGRPLQLIDCQNLFCEVDKYARVAHPEIQGVSGRSRIKQRFTPENGQMTAWFPPKWGLNCDVAAGAGSGPRTDPSRRPNVGAGAESVLVGA
jgi:hypothetical protein